MMLVAFDRFLLSDEFVTQVLNSPSVSNKLVAVNNSRIVAGQMGLIACEDLPVGSVIFVHRAKATAVRTRTSIQVAIDAHIEADGFGVFTNHSCEPNAAIRCKMMGEEATVCLISIAPIARGQEITFDYASTETVLTPQLQNAACLCGAASCRKKMKGFLQLMADEIDGLDAKGLLAQHLAEYRAQLIIEEK